MEQEQAAHAVALVAFNQATPSRADLGKYLQQMRPMLQQQHEYIAQAAVHMQIGQRIEYDAITKHITKAFKVCNTVLAGALKSLQDSSRGVQKPVRVMIQKHEDDIRHTQQDLAANSRQQGCLHDKLTEIKTLVRWHTLRGLIGAGTPSGPPSVPTTSRPPSSCSSRGESPSPLEKKALLKLEAQLCICWRLQRHDQQGTATLCCQQVLLCPANSQKRKRMLR